MTGSTDTGQFSACDKSYYRIVSYYERCLAKHGDSHLGVDWADAQEAETRYRTMLEVVQQPVAGTASLLDLGCGTAGLLDYINAHRLGHLQYTGLDLSKAFVEVSRRKYPDSTFYNLDILDSGTRLPKFDYILMNGVFTIKRDLSFREMRSYFQSMIERAYSYCTHGLAFNVRSMLGRGRERDLFYLPIDSLARFLTKRISGRFIVRHDYHDREYMVFVYRHDADVARQAIDQVEPCTTSIGLRKFAQKARDLLSNLLELTRASFRM